VYDTVVRLELAQIVQQRIGGVVPVFLKATQAPAYDRIEPRRCQRARELDFVADCEVVQAGHL
jgi:hypothetical protein